MVKKFLIIDTSGRDSFVALHHPSGTLDSEILPPLKQSQRLLPATQKLLQHEEIDFIAIGIGPGSFTGTRVGVMTAKTLSFARKIPLLPFCSLLCYIPEREGPFTIMTDAKSQGVYTLKGTKTRNALFFEEPFLQKKDLEEPLPPLNLPFLASYLLKQEKLFSHDEIQVSYLRSP